MGYTVVNGQGFGYAKAGSTYWSKMLLAFKLLGMSPRLRSIFCPNRLLGYVSIVKFFASGIFSDIYLRQMQYIQYVSFWSDLVFF